MRVVLADVKAREGFVHKDTVVGGYGARMRPFSTVTKWGCAIRKRINDVPSVTMATLGGDPGTTEDTRCAGRRGEVMEGDVALVLSSLVDHQERDAVRRRDARQGREGGLRGSRRVQDAVPLPGPRRFPDLRRAGRGRQAHGRGGDALGVLPEPRDRRPGRDSVPALGPGGRHRRAPGLDQHLLAPHRRLPRAREPQLSGVLHLLPPSDPDEIPRPFRREHRRRAGISLQAVRASLHHLP